MEQLDDRSPVKGLVGPVAPRRENREPPAPPARYASLLPWISDPTMLRPVQEFIERSDRPLMASEIAAGLGVRPYRITSALERLCAKGLVRRWKAVMHVPNNWNGRFLIKRRIWLYQRRSDAE